jgi:hypothetical protein
VFSRVATSGLADDGVHRRHPRGPAPGDTPTC